MINNNEMNPELLTGHTEIDKQHKELFELTDALKNCIVSNNVIEARRLFDGFLDNVINHFTYEEMLMYKVGYPELEIKKHKLAHRTLQEIYLVAYKPVLTGQLSITAILDLFESHFMVHLVEEDLLLATFIKKHKKDVRIRLIEHLEHRGKPSESQDSESLD